MKTIYINRYAGPDVVVSLVIDEEGARYIASVMEDYQRHDAGATEIARVIRAAIGYEEDPS